MRTAEVSPRLELGALVALCFFLPLYEAPKSIFWALYVVIWVVNRVRARDFGGRWDLWDSLIAVWVGSGFLVAAFAGLQGSEWHGALDLLRYGALLWMVRRSRYAVPETRAILGALVASTLIGLGVAYARLWSGTAQWLQLNSVGHVNHTAIYMAIILAISASGTFAFWRAWSTALRIAAIAVNAVLIVSVVVAASRGALVIAGAMLLVLGVCWPRRWRMPLPSSVAVVVVTAALLIVGGAEVVRKHQANVKANNVLSFREGIWRTALAAWERYPWCGVGMDNYRLITEERFILWRWEAGKDYVHGRYDFYPHAHSLYLNTLAERGLAGTAPLVAVLALWIAGIVRHRPRQEDPDAWLAWGAALGAWLITVGVGMVNTTLHHEHGILGVLLLALWLSRLREPRDDRR